MIQQDDGDVLEGARCHAASLRMIALLKDIQHKKEDIQEVYLHH